MYIGVPEAEPGAQGLPDFQKKHTHGPGVAHKTQEHGQAVYLDQIFFAQTIQQHPGDEGAAGQGHNAQVKSDPHSVSHQVVQPGHHKTLSQNQARRVKPPNKKRPPHGQPGQKSAEAAAGAPLGQKSMICGQARFCAHDCPSPPGLLKPRSRKLRTQALRLR